MSTRIARLILTLVFILGASSLAVAQMPPGDPGLGNKLGVQEMNNSGEDGEVTLFGRSGGRQTRVLVSLQGAPHIRPQPVSLRHGTDCDRVSTAQPISLHWLVNGRSDTVIDVPILKLLSGNYYLMVGTRLLDPNHYVSCGHLYQ